MPSQRRLLFDSSVAALVLVATPRGPTRPPMALTLGPAGRLMAPSPTGGSIQFAPESDPTTNLMDLSGDQATGPLPIGFEFELFGVRYTWFDLSSDGFMTFGTDRFPGRSDSGPKGRFIPLGTDLSNFIALGWTDACPFGKSKVRYEVRGTPGRRRLVLSFAGVPAAKDGRLGAMIAQLVLHERTGMIDVHTVRQDPASHRLKQEAVRFTTARW
jgi:hypothetical protein